MIAGAAARPARLSKRRERLALLGITGCAAGCRRPKGRARMSSSPIAARWQVSIPLIGFWIGRPRSAAYLCRGRSGRASPPSTMSLLSRSAPFDSYKTRRRGLCAAAAGAEERVTLDTGNDDQIAGRPCDAVAHPCRQTGGERSASGVACSVTGAYGRRDFGGDPGRRRCEGAWAQAPYLVGHPGARQSDHRLQRRHFRCSPVTPPWAAFPAVTRFSSASGP